MSKLTYIRVVSIAAVLTSLSFAAAVPRAVEETTYTSSDPVDSLASTSTYFTLRPDLRRCASPMCGGYFVRRVNGSRTLCANNRYAGECYVSEIDWNGHGEVEPERALLRGEIVSSTHQRFGKLGRFRVRESWQAATDGRPTAEFFRVRDLGVRCITHPCLTHHEARLNSTVAQKIAGVELNKVGASDALVQEAFTGLTSPEGILVSGTLRRVTGPAGSASTLDASQFYLRAKAQTTSRKPCIKTGCSGQVCSDEEVITTCEYRSEYECYKQARCERQANGECGFTQTPELTACLKRRGR
ncbi:MAG TPA: DUF6748 domain-containing protein [Pyrinomonadaceae bacterium]